MKRLTLLILPILTLFGVAGCSGLSSEPPIVATLIPPAPTSAPAPTLPPAFTPAPGNASGPATAGAVLGPAAPGTPASEVTGTASGRLTNQTAGGKVPNGLTVTLLMSDMSSTSAIPATQTTTADADGNFTFRNVPIRANWIYGASTEYQGRVISGTVVTGDPAAPSLTLPLALYDITSDPKVLTISSMITKIIADSSGLQVAQVLHFTNSSDRMYSTDTKASEKLFASIVLPIPEGAQVMGFMDSSGRFVLSGDGRTLSDTNPVLPNTDHVVHYIYTMPYSESGTTITQAMPYAINGPAHFAIQPAAITFNSTQLTGTGTQSDPSTGDMNYVGMLKLNPGDTFRFNLSGAVAASVPGSGTAPAAQAAGPVSRDLLTGLLIGAGFGLIVVGGLFLARDLSMNRGKGHRATASQAPAGTGAAPTANADQLVAQLAQLDQRFESGQLSQSSYERKRRSLKLKLAELMEKQ